MLNILVITKLFPTKFQKNSNIFNKVFLDYLCQNYSDIQVKVIRALPIGNNINIVGKKIHFHPLLVKETKYEVLFPRIISFYKYFSKYHHILYYLTLKRLIKKLDYNFDIIHSHWLYPDGFVAVKLGKYFNKPTIVHCHGSDINVLLLRKNLNKFNSYTIKQSDKIIVVSNDLRKKIVSLYPEINSKVDVVYNGVDFSTFKKKDKSISLKLLGINNTIRYRILYVGNILKEKGIFDLIDAIKILSLSRNDFKLNIVGNGSREIINNLKNTLKTENLNNYVEIIGECDHKLIEHWFNISNLTVLPSHSEGFGIVLIESLATGTQVLATNVGGIPEIVNNEIKGKLIPPQDPRALAYAIDEFLSKDKKTDIPLSEIQEFDIKVQAQRIMEIYKKLNLLNNG